MFLLQKLNLGSNILKKIYFSSIKKGLIGNMVKNKFKKQMNEIPIENHRTAAWANIENLKRVSRVPIPSDYEVANAKDYVDKNQK